MDMMRFRVAWWFKNLGKGCEVPVTILSLNITDRCIDNKKVKVAKVRGWMPPMVDSLKFNVDGSFRESKGQAGIGGVLRDCKGNVLCIFSEKVGCNNTILTKILAINRACQLCFSRQELKFKSIVIVSDSLTAVSWINSSGVGSWAHSHLIMEIRNLLGILR